MTKLIVELGGDVHFETTCDPGTLNFVVGSGTSKYSAIRIASELKKVEFSKEREITNKHMFLRNRYTKNCENTDTWHFSNTEVCYFQLS